MESLHSDYMAADIRYQTAIEAQEVTLFSLLKPSLQQDGDQWCVLYGDNLQVGVAGFGDSPNRAIQEFNKAWYQSIANKRPTSRDIAENIISSLDDRKGFEFGDIDDSIMEEIKVEIAGLISKG